MPDKTARPERQEPQNWEHHLLWQNVVAALTRIPLYFQSTISVSGINATELYAFGNVLGLTIEQEVVRTLNNLKSEWDADNHYPHARFVRQPQNFPDVLLTQGTSRADVLLGIELKSWYLLAKEGEPSFRFTVTPLACAPQDLIVIVPWVLSNVLSGSPIIFEPYIAPARYIAEYRNYWWQNLRDASKDTAIQSLEKVSFYPAVRDEISDKALEDKGKNFGRIARLGIMDEYIRSFGHVNLLGLEAATWREFFKKKIEPLSVEDADEYK